MSLPPLGAINRSRPWTPEALGTDLAFGLDVIADPAGEWGTVTGDQCLLEDLAHRFATPRGSYAIHPEYGSNVNDFLHSRMGELELRALAVEVKETLEDDPRVDEAVARAERVGSAVTVHAAVTIAARVNPLNLVFGWDLATKSLMGADLAS